MNITKDEVKYLYEMNLVFKIPIIYDYLDNVVEKDKSDDFYYGMLVSISNLLILIDYHTREPILSGIAASWVRNLSLVIMSNMLEKEFNEFPDELFLE